MARHSGVPVRASGTLLGRKQQEFLSFGQFRGRFERFIYPLCNVWHRAADHVSLEIVRVCYMDILYGVI